MTAVTDSSHLYEVERRARHAERPGFRISELQISPSQQVPWHCHTHVQDTFYVLEGRLRLFLRATFLVLQGIGEYDYVPLVWPDVTRPPRMPCSAATPRERTR